MNALKNCNSHFILNIIRIPGSLVIKRKHNRKKLKDQLPSIIHESNITVEVKGLVFLPLIVFYGPTCFTTLLMCYIFSNSTLFFKHIFFPNSVVYCLPSLLPVYVFSYFHSSTFPFWLVCQGNPHSSTLFLYQVCSTYFTDCQAKMMENSANVLGIVVESSTPECKKMVKSSHVWGWFCMWLHTVIVGKSVHNVDRVREKTL